MDQQHIPVPGLHRVECISCGSLKSPASFTAAEPFTCRTCRDKPRKVCTACGESKVMRAFRRQHGGKLINASTCNACAGFWLTKAERKTLSAEQLWKACDRGAITEREVHTELKLRENPSLYPTRDPVQRGKHAGAVSNEKRILARWGWLLKRTRAAINQCQSDMRRYRNDHTPYGEASRAFIREYLGLLRKLRALVNDAITNRQPNGVTTESTLTPDALLGEAELRHLRNSWEHRMRVRHEQRATWAGKPLDTPWLITGRDKWLFHAMPGARRGWPPADKTPAGRQTAP